jgi:5-aminolevulinate synthase
MSTATHYSPGGGTITNLQFIARRCPVMNKALAVQSARIRPSSVGRVASGVGIKSAMMKNLHTTADKKANLDPRMYHKKDEGKIEG